MRRERRALSPTRSSGGGRPASAGGGKPVAGGVGAGGSKIGGGGSSGSGSVGGGSSSAGQRGGRSSGRSGGDQKGMARAPSPDLVDDGEESDQSLMLSELARIVADLHEAENVGMKDVASQLGVMLDIPDATKKVNVLVIGSGGCAMDFVEWYIGDRLHNSGVAGFGDFTVVTNGISSRSLHGVDALAALPGFKNLESYSGLSRSFAYQELAVTKRKLDSVNVVIAPVIEGTIQSRAKGWQEQALAVMRDYIGRNSQSLLRIFRAFDINKDRRVSLPEFRKALESMDLAHLSEAQALELMNLIDLDQNGYINYEDFVSAFKPHPVKYEYDLEAALLAVADTADVILALLDPSTLRFNIRELDAVQMLGEKHRNKLQIYFHLRDHLQAERNLKSQLAECTRVVAERLSDRHLLNIEACYIPRNQVFGGVSRNAVKDVATVLNAKSHAIAMRCVSTTKQNIAKLMNAVVKFYDTLSKLEPPATPGMHNARPYERSIVMDGSGQDLSRSRLKMVLDDLILWMTQCSQRILSSDEKPMQLLREGILDGIRLAKKIADAESDEQRQYASVLMWQKEQARQKLLLEVESGDVLTWNSPDHLWAWLSLIGMDTYRSAFEEQSVCNARLLLSLSRADLEDLGVRVADRKIILAKTNELRMRLYTGKLETYYQALWTLLAQKLINSSELQTVYAILAGDVNVPEHRRQALQDGLRMLHLGLIPANAVMEVIKDLREHVTRMLSLEDESYLAARHHHQ